MYKFGGCRCRVDIFMTPEHNHYSRNDLNKPFVLKKAKDICYSPTEHRRDFPYSQNKEEEYFYLPAFKKESISYRKNGTTIRYISEYKEKRIEMDVWLKFLAWYLTEGSVGGRRYCGLVKPYSVSIPQSKTKNPKYCEEIEKVLSNFNKRFNIQERKNINTYSFADTQLANILRDKYGNSFSKFIDRELLNKLSVRQCKLLLEEMIKGDGSIKKSKTTSSFSYTTVSKRLADDLQELALKAGYVAIISHFPVKKANWYGVNITNNDTPKTWKRLVRNWSGNTYDINIKNHVFFIRRNGKVCWTGNCYKSNRGKLRKDSGIDFKYWYEKFNELIEKLKNSTPFCFIKEDLCEADDVIAVASRYFKSNTTVIISSDGDFEQLVAYPNVRLFSPVSKSYKYIKNPYATLAKKFKQERTDNLLSPIIDESDFERRKLLVNLLELPPEVENKILDKLVKLSYNEYSFDYFPYPKMVDRFIDIYNSNHIVDYDKSINKKIKKYSSKKTKKKGVSKNVQDNLEIF